MQKRSVEQEKILVITDDISLPFGVLRLRKKGSAGGHNGLYNIQESLGNSSYSRLRFGIGNDFPRGHQSDYVLSSFTDENNKTIDERIAIGIKMVQSFVTIGIERTMSDFNGK